MAKFSYLNTMTKPKHTCGADPAEFVTVQAGWVDDVVNGERVRYARMVSIPWVFDKSVVCGYARRAEDQACAHCWRSKA